MLVFFPVFSLVFNVSDWKCQCGDKVLAKLPTDSDSFSFFHVE